MQIEQRQLLIIAEDAEDCFTYHPERRCFEKRPETTENA